MIPLLLFSLSVFGAEPRPFGWESPDTLWLYDHQGAGNSTTVDLWGIPDPTLTQQIKSVLHEVPSFERAYTESRLSLVVVDITDPKQVVYAAFRPDREVFTASLSKIAILLGVFHVARTDPAFLSEREDRLVDLIRYSSNVEASALYREVGVDRMHAALTTHGLYDDTSGGLWWTLRADGRPSPISKQTICGTARQVARFFLLMEQGRLVSPKDSFGIKPILEGATLSSFSQAIQKANPGVKYYAKPGILEKTVTEGALIEGPHGTRYIFAILTYGFGYRNPDIIRFSEALHRVMVNRHM